MKENTKTLLKQKSQDQELDREAVEAIVAGVEVPKPPPTQDPALSVSSNVPPKYEPLKAAQELHLPPQPYHYLQ